MEIEFKNIIGQYLNYGISIAKLDYDNNFKRLDGKLNIGTYNDVIKYRNVQLILKPLKDLQKITQEEYEYIHEKFGVLCSHIWDLNNIFELNYASKFEFVCYLCSKGYDVFGLLENKLAYDSNLLK